MPGALSSHAICSTFYFPLKISFQQRFSQMDITGGGGVEDQNTNRDQIGNASNTSSWSTSKAADAV